MEKLIALADFTHDLDGRALEAGDEFETTERLAGLYRAAGRARKPGVDAAPEVGRAKPPRGRYDRRDLRAR